MTDTYVLSRQTDRQVAAEKYVIVIQDVKVRKDEPVHAKVVSVSYPWTYWVVHDVRVCVVEDVKEIYFIWDKNFSLTLGNSLYSVQYMKTWFLIYILCFAKVVSLYECWFGLVEFTLWGPFLSLVSFLISSYQQCFFVLPPRGSTLCFARIVFWLASYFFMNNLTERASLIRSNQVCVCDYQILL